MNSEKLLDAHLPRTLCGCQTPDRKSTRLNSSHGYISYAVFCLKKKSIRRYATRADTNVSRLVTVPRSLCPFISPWLPSNLALDHLRRPRSPPYNTYRYSLPPDV